MPPCLICLCDVDKLLTLPCGCCVCPDCLFNWSKSYCEDNIFTNEIQLPCPFEHCRKPMRQDQFIPLIEPKRADEINSLLLQHYLTHVQDVRMCPKPKCNYAGVISDLPKNCWNYTCPQCGSSWTDPAHLGAGDKVSAWLKKGASIRNELLSNLIKLFMGNDCPNCSTHITKNGGCSHMVCSKCKYEFCWMCLDAYYGYHHSGTRPCGLRLFYMFFTFLFMLFPIISRVSCYFPATNGFFWGLLFLVKYVPLGLLELVGMAAIPVWIIGTICDYNHRRLGLSVACLRIFCLFLAFAAYLAYNWFLYKQAMLSLVWKVIFYFACVVAVSLVGGLLIGSGADLLRYGKSMQAVALFNGFICEILAVLIIYIDYYPRILLLCFINVEFALITASMMTGPLWCGRTRCESLFCVPVVFILAAIYNGVLICCKLFIVFKLSGFFGLLSVAGYLWLSTRAIRFPYFLGLTAAGTYLYYAYVV